MIRISPSHPDGVIVISVARSPIPSPTAPTPWLIAGDHRANRDSRSESNQSCGDDAWCGSDINYRGIVNRNVNHLRICRLDDVDRLTRGGLLYFYLILLVGPQRARGIGLCAQALNRSGYGRLVRRKCNADSGVIVNIFRHHGHDLRKIHQRDKRGIEARRLCRIGERGAAEIGILLQPVIHVENFLRIGAGSGDLRQQRIRIEGDGSEQLVQFFGSGRRRVLRADQWHKVLRKQKCEQQNYGGEGALS